MMRKSILLSITERERERTKLLLQFTFPTGIIAYFSKEGCTAICGFSAGSLKTIFCLKKTAITPPPHFPSHTHTQTHTVSQLTESNTRINSSHMRTAEAFHKSIYSADFPIQTTHFTAVTEVINITKLPSKCVFACHQVS